MFFLNLTFKTSRLDSFTMFLKISVSLNAIDILLKLRVSVPQTRKFLVSLGANSAKAVVKFLAS